MEQSCVLPGVRSLLPSCTKASFLERKTELEFSLPLFWSLPLKSCFCFLARQC